MSQDVINLDQARWKRTHRMAMSGHKVLKPSPGVAALYTRRKATVLDLCRHLLHNNDEPEPPEAA